MASPLGSELPLGCSRGLLLVTWRFPISWFWSVEDGVVLGSISWQFGFSLFVLGHFFLFDMSLEFDMKWAGVPRSFGPTIAPQNLAARLLGRGGGLWCSWAYIMASWVLFPYYEAAQIWRLRVPLGIGRNLFRLTFPLWALCAVNSPRSRLLYKTS